jgi:ribosomal-protein-alanine N-acetyltransferase
VFELRRVEAGHAPAVLQFELANRAFFAASNADRGNRFFRRFDEGWVRLLALQEGGTCAFHLLLDEDGSVVGRFNLVDIEGGTAELGYRVAEHVTGRGVATAAVRELCRRAVEHYRLHTLRAAVADHNVASRRVLAKAGFVAVGPATAAELDGTPGRWFRLDLTARPGKPAS